MRKLILLLFLLFTISIAAQTTPPIGFVTPSSWAAMGPSGTFGYITVDTSGNLITTLNPKNVGFFSTTSSVSSVAPVALDSNGNWQYLQIDGNGNLKVSQLANYTSGDLSVTGNFAITGYANGLYRFGNGSTTQPTNGLQARVPSNQDVETGSSTTPTTGKYQTKPSIYISDYGATDASGCIIGMAAPCLSPMLMIEATNQASTTSADLTGIIVNLWGAKAATSPSPNGNQWIGGAFQMYDSATSNVVNMTGLNPNITALSVPTGCFKGSVGSATCARSMNGIEVDITGIAATAPVWEQSVGNKLTGYTANCYTGDCTAGIQVTTGTTGQGWLVGAILGGSKSVGLLITQQGINTSPRLGAQIANSGNYGLVLGSGSSGDTGSDTYYAHGISQTNTNPSIAGLLLDAKRVEGTTGLAQSNLLAFRTATGAASYLHWVQYLDTNGTIHWQTDKASPGTGTIGTLVDAISYAPNATAVNSFFRIIGQVAASNIVILKYDGTNGLYLTGTPTGGLSAWTLQNLAGGSDSLVGRATTDVLSNKTLSVPTISGVMLGTSGQPITIRGGSTTTNDLVVQNNAATLNGLIVDESGNVFVGANGSTTVYRCATAGTLPIGALTTNTASCGSTTDTGLRTK